MIIVPQPAPINTAIAFLKRCEDALLVLLLLGMIGMAAGQVLLRNFFDGGVYWGDSAVRVMVLWVTMLAPCSLRPFWQEISQTREYLKLLVNFVVREWL